MMFAVVALIGLLIVLIGWGKVPPFLAFLLTALAGALCFGMPLDQVAKSLEHGVGEMLGGLTAIICLGAMFGRAIADSGAAQSIARSLIGLVGLRFILLAMALTGLIVGIPLFYSVGFVVMIPLIFSVARRAELPPVYVGLPLLCGLSVAHGFLPPHPSPTALVKLFGADTGLTLVYGLVVSLVALLVAGPLLALTLKRFGLCPQAAPEDAAPVAFLSADAPEDKLPGPVNSFSTALAPVVMIAAATAAIYALKTPSDTKTVIGFIGQPVVVLSLSLIYATFSLGVARGVAFTTTMQRYAESLKDVAGILLILAGAGALKQVFVDSGVSTELGGWLQSVPVHPLVLGWLIAMVIRVALGSATIAGLTAAGLLQPVVAASHVDPNLMVLAVGAGSLMFSHVNDPGFWLFKEYFNLSLKDTFRTWTVMESVAGTVGLLCVLGLNMVVG
ncbi:gluconate transporter [Caulobacter sp. AP07]|uniref:GntP family permease n=1 Tax=Caulobacter sp. AP07 TaxID=1144304 RepID=UPI000272075F|nr:gluconate:H+ symporter [Caulobacter sp. AP07]EJL22154.1 gluconate transporter [Caulobacter sp. AP07]